MKEVIDKTNTEDMFDKDFTYIIQLTDDKQSIVVCGMRSMISTQLVSFSK